MIINCLPLSLISRFCSLVEVFFCFHTCIVTNSFHDVMDREEPKVKQLGIKWNVQTETVGVCILLDSTIKVCITYACVCVHLYTPLSPILRLQGQCPTFFSQWVHSRSHANSWSVPPPNRSSRTLLALLNTLLPLW